MERSINKLRTQREATSALRRDWKKSHPIPTLSRYSIPLPEAVAIRNMKSQYRINEMQEHRVSERGKKFLQTDRQNSRENLSTPKYFTKFNTRASTLLPDRNIRVKPESCKALVSPRLSIPAYKVPTHLPELSDVMSLVSAVPNSTSKPDQKELMKSDISEWLRLVERSVPLRPSFSEPITCKTPNMEVDSPNYQKPLGGIFKGVTRKALSRDYTVNPEFLSESVQIRYIQGQSSNPLKYGWVG